MGNYISFSTDYELVNYPNYSKLLNDLPSSNLGLASLIAPTKTRSVSPTKSWGASSARAAEQPGGTLRLVEVLMAGRHGQGV